MSVMTRPGQRSDQTAAAFDATAAADRFKPREVSAETTNALVTEAALNHAELLLLRDHFKTLFDLLVVAGPRFTSARRDAADMHNRAIRRLKGIRDEAKRRETQQADADLIEIG